MPDAGNPRDDTPPARGQEAEGQGRTSSSSANRVWIQFRDVIFERMAAVDAAVSAVRKGKLDPEVRQKAVLEAHRLAGSLGMFGLMEGTQHAREIEHLLTDETAATSVPSRRLTELATALRQILERGPA